MSSNKL